MSLVLTEQAKYRLTGGVVFIALILLILPGLMKKSNQRFEENLSLSLKVPPKPSAPKLKIPSAKQVFAGVQVKELPAPKIEEREVKVVLSQAEPLLPSVVPSISMQNASNIEVAAVSKPTVKPKHAAYAIQLATFSHAENARFLVDRLKKLGYEAESNTIDSKNGPVYRVLVSDLKDKEKAVQVQKNLANNVQLQGMIVKQG